MYFSKWSDFLSSGQLVTGSTKLLYKGTDGTSRTIDPDNYALKSDVGDYSDMNNELVKYGKEIISEAITDKGVSTASTDSFDDMATNIRNINTQASGTVGEMNIYCSISQPTAQNGLWIKRNRSEVSNILIKEDYYLEDGIVSRLPITYDKTVESSYSNYITGVSSDGKLYCWRVGNTSNGSAPWLYCIDTDTNTATIDTTSTTKYYNADFSSNTSFIYDDTLFFAKYTATDNSLIYTNININTGLPKYSNPRVSFSNGSLRYIASTVINNILYVSAIYEYSTSIKQIRIYSLDLTTLTTDTTASTMWMTQLISVDILNYPLSLSSDSFSYNTRVAKLVYYNNTLYYFVKEKLLFTYDITNKNYTIPDYTIYPKEYTIAQCPIAVCNFNGKVFYIGTTANTEDKSNLTDIVVYDIPTSTSSVIKNVIDTNITYPFIKLNFSFGYCQKDNIFYILGAYDSSSSSYKMAVSKYTIQSNTYNTGTIICQPTTTGNHITNMYSSDLVTLNYGIDDVYYQAADGFHKQDAAIIKDGVVTDI